jgi:hypothetical protein
VAAPIGLLFHSPRQLFANAAIRWAPSASMCSVEAEPDAARFNSDAKVDCECRVARAGGRRHPAVAA